MNTKILDKLLNLIYLFEEESEWENYNVSRFDFFESYHKDLYDELNQNLFGKSYYCKEDVIKHYLLNSYLTFKTLESIRNDNELYENNITTHNFIKNEFEGVIKIIINNCFSFGIDFSEIAQNLKIPIKTIDMGYFESQKILFDYSDSDSISENKLYIFKDSKSYELFLYHYTINENKKTYRAEISYLYRIMYEEGLIQNFCRPEIFRNWLVDNNFKNTNSPLNTFYSPKSNKKYHFYNESKNRFFLNK